MRHAIWDGASRCRSDRVTTPCINQPAGTPAGFLLPDLAPGRPAGAFFRGGLIDDTPPRAARTARPWPPIRNSGAEFMQLVGRHPPARGPSRSQPAPCPTPPRPARYGTVRWPLEETDPQPTNWRNPPVEPTPPARGPHARPWPDAEPTRRVTMQAKLLESPTRPLRLGPWLGRGEVFRGRVDRLDHPEIKTRHIESCAFSLPTKANTKRAAMVSKRAATPNRPTCTEGLETLIMLAFSLFSRFCQGCSAGTDERFFQSLAS